MGVLEDAMERRSQAKCDTSSQLLHLAHVLSSLSGWPVYLSLGVAVALSSSPFAPGAPVWSRSVQLEDQGVHRGEEGRVYHGVEAGGHWPGGDAPGIARASGKALVQGLPLVLPVMKQLWTKSITLEA